MTTQYKPWSLPFNLFDNPKRKQKDTYNPGSKEVANKIQAFLKNKGEIEKLDPIKSPEISSAYYSDTQNHVKC